MYTLFYSILPMFMNGILNIFNIEINSAVNILPIFNKGSILPIFNIRINNTIRYKSLWVAIHLGHIQICFLTDIQEEAL